MSRPRPGPAPGAAAPQGAERFTAVVVADTFTHDFKPLTLATPRALIPLANVPVIDYTIEFLVLNGVEEIFVLCAAHAKQIEQHILASRWANASDVHIRVLVAKCENPGDAIRHLNDYDVLRQDFILISADVVSNFTHLHQLYRRHKERREADPSILLTLVFREEEYCPAAGAADPHGRPLLPTSQISVWQPLVEEYVTAIMEPATGILHSCQPWVSRSFVCNEATDAAEEVEVPRYLTVDLKLLKDNPTLNCRSDLIDTNIVICSLEVLSLFKQEFDFFDIKHDCVQSILEHDVLGNKMAADVIRAPFYGRIASYNHYAAISQAILGRWLTPMSPEEDFSGRGVTYAAHPNDVYVAAGTKVARGVSLECDVLVGPHTVVEAGAVLTHCTIGARCHIGRNAKITHSYVWDNVHVGEGCALDRCLVATGARVQPGATVSPGTVVGQAVVIGAGHRTIPNSRLYVGDETDPLAVGEEGTGSLWAAIGPEIRFLDVHMPKELEDDEDSLDDGFKDLLGIETRARRPTSTSCAPEQNFFLEMQQLIHRALRERHQQDNSMLEIIALKFAYNRSFQDCARGTMRGFVTYFDDGVRNPKEFKDDLLRVLKKPDAPPSGSKKAEEGWASAFAKFVSSESDCEVQLEMLDELLALAKARKVVQSSLVHLLMFFHDEDILSEEGILKWVRHIDEHGTLEEKSIRGKCDRFIEWLQEGDEEDED